MEYIIALLIIVIPIISYICFSKGKKVGASEFFKLIANFGYQSKVNAFRTQNKHVPLGGVVFLGDSITQDYNVYEAFPGHLVYNRGIGGDTTEGVLNRLDVSVFELKPKAVVMLIGTNDFALLKSSVEEVFERIKNIVETIKEKLPTCDVIVQSVYPVNETLDKMTVLPRNNHDIDILNSMIQTLNTITYVDVSSHLKDENGRFKEIYTLEGLHVSPLGYEVVTHLLSTLLD
jgi:lysophospholipase L1-like esterase